MTCIVGIEHEGKVYVGGDSAGVGGLALTVRSDVKVFRNGETVMGFTSSFRMGQLLHYAFSPPHHDPSVELDKYMVTTFMDAVRQCLKDGGYAKKDREQEEGGVFLVGYRGRLFIVHDDYQVGSAVDGFAAVGCGDQIAHGALYATREWSDQEARIRLALEAAERFSAGVRAPFRVEVLG